MYALTVIAYVLENEIETFLQKTVECARAPHSESGNLRYENDPLCFVFMEFIARKRIFNFVVKRRIP